MKPAKEPFTDHRLATLEDVISAGKQTFFEVGNALAEIMEDRLYKAKGFGSFAEYCWEVWGFKKSYAYQLVKTSEMLKEQPQLSTMVENPRQARELAKVPVEHRVEVALEAGEKATAKEIKKAATKLSTMVENPRQARELAKVPVEHRVEVALEAGEKATAKEIKKAATKLSTMVENPRQQEPKYKINLKPEVAPLSDAAQEALDSIKLAKENLDALSTLIDSRECDADTVGEVMAHLGELRKLLLKYQKEL